MSDLGKPVTNINPKNPNDRRVVKRRIFDLLPGVFQTDTNRKLFGSVVDPLYQPQNTENLIGYIGEIPDYYNPIQDFYVNEINQERQFYQLIPFMVSRNLETNNYERELFYNDLINYLRFRGGNTENHSRLFSQEYYSWQPPIDLDKFMNFQDYFWIPVGPEPTIITDLTDVESDIIGKTGRENSIPTVWDEVLSSGSKVILTNDVNSDYNERLFFVEGVGREIQLVEDDAIANGWDLYPWDTTLWDELSQLSFAPDYVVMERGAHDGNQWSKTNRWFHREVIKNFYDPELFKVQATRPIIEFEKDLELWNTGNIDRGFVDVVISDCSIFYSSIQNFSGGWDNPEWDTATVGCGYEIGGWDDIWPNTNLGYSEVFITDSFGDTVQLRDGLRILLTNDSRPGADDRIYEVTGIQSDQKIILQPISNGVNIDGSPAQGERITQISPSGIIRTYWYNGDDWVLGQNKLTINQPPRFQLYDVDGIPLNDSGQYPENDFNTKQGNKIFSYLEDTDPGAPVDRVTGFRIVRNSFGEIVFQNDLVSDRYTYIDPVTRETKDINGYYFWRIRREDDNTKDEYSNSWHLIPEPSRQYYTQRFSTVDGLEAYFFELTPDPESFREPLVVRLDGVKLENGDGYIHSEGTNFLFLSENPGGNRILEISVISDETPALENGFYEIPLNLAANPNNLEIEQVGFNQVFDQFYDSISKQPESDTATPFARTNYRDSSKLRYLGENILQHSAPLLKTMALASNAEIDVIKSIKYVQREYVRFKNKFINKLSQIFKAQSLDSQDLELWVDTVLEEINVGKNTEFPFNNTGMGYKQVLNPKRSYIPPTPAFLGITPTYEPKVFEDSTFTNTIKFIEGHDGSLTPGFEDFRDDVLLELEQRIFNSIQPRFKDPDRIPLLSKYDVIPGRWRRTEYSRSEIREINRPGFEVWAAQSGVDYRENRDTAGTNPFAINYSKTEDKFGDSPPGGWRGIYLWYFDTDRPHEAPWEMLGFSLKPSWWDQEYGSAPYTSGNMKLWTDLEEGRIRQGNRAGIDSRFIREGLTDSIPVDRSGNLLAPVSAGVIKRLPNNEDAVSDWQFGDMGPIETAWFKSEFYSYDLSEMLYLTKPAQFIEYNWDSSSIEKVFDTGIDRSDPQIINRTYNTRPPHYEIVVHNESQSVVDNTAATYEFDIFNGLVRNFGIQQIVSNYLTNQGKDITLKLGNIIRGLNVQLGHRVGGFVDKTATNLDTDSFGRVPKENITTLLYKSNSTREVFYGGVIVEKSRLGYKVYGYDILDPVFNTIPGDTKGRKGTVGVGNAGRPHSVWQANTEYLKGDTVLLEENETYYRALGDHRSGNTFNPSRWVKVSIPPTRYQLKVNKKFEAVQGEPTRRVIYGTEFKTVQEVFDFLIDYERYLVKQGFIFDQHNPETGETIDWTWSGKEFMVWTLSQPEEGEVISLSPASEFIKFKAGFGYIEPVEQIVQGVYSLLNKDGIRIEPKETVVSRYEDTIEIKPYEEGDEDSLLYAARLFITEIEHIIAIDNKTIFNDILYNPQFNIRQPRMRIETVRAIGWTGRYSASGYIISNDTLIPNYDKLADQFQYIFDTTNARLVEDTWKTYGYHNIGYQNREYLDQLIISQQSQLDFYRGMIQQKGTADTFNKLLRSEFVTRTSDLFFYEEWALRVGTYGDYDKKPSFEVQFSQDYYKQNPQLTEFPRIPATPVSSVPTETSGNPQWIWTRKDENIYRKNADETAYELINTSARKLDTGSLDNPFDNVLRVFTIEDAETGKIIAGDRRWGRRPDTTVTDLGEWVFPTRPLNRDQQDLPTAGYIKRGEADYTVFGRDELFDLYDTAKESQSGFQDGEIIWVYNTNQLPASKYYNPDFDVLRNSVQDQRWTAFRISEYKRSIRSLENIINEDSGIEANIGFAYKERFTFTSSINTYGLTTLVESENDLILVKDEAEDFIEVSEDDFSVTGPIINLSGGLDSNEKLFVAYPQIERPDLTLVERFRASATVTEFTLSEPTFSINSVEKVKDTRRLSAVTTSPVGDVNVFQISVNGIVVSAGAEDLPEESLVGITVYTQAVESTYWISYRLEDNTEETDGRTYTERFETDVISSAVTFSLFRRPALESITVSAALTTNISAVSFITEHNPYVIITSGRNKDFLHIEYTESGEGISVTDQYKTTVSATDKAVRLTLQPDYSSVRVYEGTPRNTQILQPSVSAVFTSGTQVSIINKTGDFRIENGAIVFTSAISLVSGDSLWLQYLANDPTTSNISVEHLATDGSTTDFNLRVSAQNPDTVLVVEDGIILHQGADFDYQVSGNEIRFSTAPSGETWVQYVSDDRMYLSGFSSFSAKTTSNIRYELNQETVTNGALVTVNGNILEPETDFIVSGRNTLIFTELPPLGSELRVRYINPIPAVNNQDIVIFDFAESTENLPFEGIHEVKSVSNNGDIRIELNEVDFGNIDLESLEELPKVYFLQELRFPNFEHYAKHVETAKYGNIFGGPSPNQLIFIDDGRTQDQKPHGTPFWTVHSLSNTLPRWFEPFGGGSGTYHPSESDFLTGFRIRRQEPKVETGLFYNARIYDKRTNELKTVLDVYDPAKNRLPGKAEREIWYKLDYDPAKYTNGDANLHQVDPGQHWGPAQVGRVWWDLRTARFLDYEISSNTYRRDNWGRLAPGSSIDVYEWVRSHLSPEDYQAEAEAQSGVLAGTVSETPSGNIYSPDSPAFVSQEEYNPEIGDIQTFYYFWVKNKITLPNKEFRNTSVNQVANIIENPTSQGIIWCTPINKDAVVVANAFEFTSDENTMLQFNWSLDPETTNWHKQWVMGREGDPSYTVDSRLYQKMVDSLVGFDHAELVVPDPGLNSIEKYGSLFRPRQTMFVDRLKARSNLVDIVNAIFENINFVDTRLDYKDTFNQEDNPPSRVTVNGKRVSINHNVADFGQRDFLQQTGTITDSSGNNIVLVEQNPEMNNFWSIWRLVDSDLVVWELVEAQRYKTSDFYRFADYYEEGINKNNIPLKQYADIAERDQALLENLILDGDTVFVEDANGSWEWQLYEEGQFKTVAKQGASIALSNNFFLNREKYGINEDWGNLTKEELRLKIANRKGDKELQVLLDTFEGSNVIFNEELNTIFFNMVRFAFSENQVIDWAFKTSYILFGGVIENLGQDTVLRPVLFDSLIDYITEVKPYHVKFREYARRIATALDSYNYNVTDFDNPVWLDSVSGEYKPLDPMSAGDQDVLSTRPWKYWFENYLQNPELIRNLRITEKFDRISCSPEFIEQHPENQVEDIFTPEFIRIFSTGSRFEYDLLIDDININTFPAFQNYDIYKIHSTDPFLPVVQIWSQENIREISIKDPQNGLVTTLRSDQWEIVEVQGNNPPVDNFFRLILSVIVPAGQIIEIRRKLSAADRIGRFYNPIQTLWNGKAVNQPLPELNYNDLISGCSFRGTRVEGGSFTADPFDIQLQILDINKGDIAWDLPNWDTVMWDGDNRIYNISNLPNNGRDYTYDIEVSGTQFSTPAVSAESQSLTYIVEGNTFTQPNTRGDRPEELVVERILNPLGITVHNLDHPGAPKTDFFKTYTPIPVAGMEFPIPILPQSREAVFVFLDEILLRENEDYEIDWNRQKVILTDGYTNENHKVEIVAYSIGGKFIQDSTSVVFTVGTSAPDWGEINQGWGVFEDEWGYELIEETTEDWVAIEDDWGSLEYFWGSETNLISPEWIGAPNAWTEFGDETWGGSPIAWGGVPETVDVDETETIVVNTELGEEPIIFSRQFKQVKDSIPGSTSNSYELEADNELLDILKFGEVFCSVDGVRIPVSNIIDNIITLGSFNADPEDWIIFEVFKQRDVAAVVYTTHYQPQQTIALRNRSGPENELDSTLVFVNGERQIGPRIRYIKTNIQNPSPNIYDAGFNISNSSALRIYINDVEIDQFSLITTSSIQVNQNVPGNSIVKIIDLDGEDYSIKTIADPGQFTARWSTANTVSAPVVYPGPRTGDEWDEFAWDFNASTETVFLQFREKPKSTDRITVVTFNNNSSMGIRTEYFEGKAVPSYSLAFEPFKQSNLWASVDGKNLHWNLDYRLAKQEKSSFNGIWREEETPWPDAVAQWNEDPASQGIMRITFQENHLVAPEKLGFDPSVSATAISPFFSLLSADSTWQDVLDLWLEHSEEAIELGDNLDITPASAIYSFGFDEDWFDGGLPIIYKKPVYVTYMTEYQKEDGYSFKYFQADDPFIQKDITVVRDYISQTALISDNDTEPFRISDIEISPENITVQTSGSNGLITLPNIGYDITYESVGSTSSATFVNLNAEFLRENFPGIITSSSKIKATYKSLELRNQESIRIGFNNNYELYTDVSAGSSQMQVLQRQTLPAFQAEPGLITPNKAMNIPGVLWIGENRFQYWDILSIQEVSAGTVYTIDLENARSGTKHTADGVRNQDEYVRFAADGEDVEFEVSGISTFSLDDITASRIEYIIIPGSWDIDPAEDWDNFRWDQAITEGQDYPYTVKTSSSAIGDYEIIDDSIVFVSAPTKDPLSNIIIGSNGRELLKNIIITKRYIDFKKDKILFTKGTPVLNGSKSETIPGGYIENTERFNPNEQGRFQYGATDRFLINKKQKPHKP